MKPATSYLILLLAMGAATYLPRALPLVVFSKKPMPSWLAEWLELIPPAILGALLAPTLFVDSTHRTVTLGNLELLAAVPTLLCALLSRSLAGTVIVGILSYWGLGVFL